MVANREANVIETITNRPTTTHKIPLCLLSRSSRVRCDAVLMMMTIGTKETSGEWHGAWRGSNIVTTNFRGNFNIRFLLCWCVKRAATPYFINFRLMEILTQIDISARAESLRASPLARSPAESGGTKKRIKLKCYELCAVCSLGNIKRRFFTHLCVARLFLCFLPKKVKCSVHKINQSTSGEMRERRLAQGRRRLSQQSALFHRIRPPWAALDPSAK